MSFKSYAVMGLAATAMTLLAVATAASVNSHPSAGLLNNTFHVQPTKFHYLTWRQGGRKQTNIQGVGGGSL